MPNNDVNKILEQIEARAELRQCLVEPEVESKPELSDEDKVFNKLKYPPIRWRPVTGSMIKNLMPMSVADLIIGIHPLSNYHEVDALTYIIEKGRK